MTGELDAGDLSAVNAGLAAIDGVRLLAQLAAENLTGSDALYWTCEHCGATPGVPCQSSGVNASYPPRPVPSHKSRREQAGRFNRLAVNAHTVRYLSTGAAWCSCGWETHLRGTAAITAAVEHERPTAADMPD